MIILFVGKDDVNKDWFLVLLILCLLIKEKCFRFKKCLIVIKIFFLEFLLWYLL